MPGPDAPKDLIEFPSRFPIKAMGPNNAQFVASITSLAGEHDPTFDAASVQVRDSTAGKYVSVTVVVTATSREQLDNLYRAIQANPQVKFVL